VTLSLVSVTGAFLDVELLLGFLLVGAASAETSELADDAFLLEVDADGAMDASVAAAGSADGRFLAETTRLLLGSTVQWMLLVCVGDSMLANWIWIKYTHPLTTGKRKLTELLYAVPVLGAAAASVASGAGAAGALVATLAHWYNPCGFSTRPAKLRKPMELELGRSDTV
jgi:hypothetical protein